jgi:small subunit ribosomal protein S8
MSIDSIGNFLTRIRNALMASKPSVEVSHSNMNEQIALLLKQEGFVKDVQVIDNQDAFKTLKVVLKYVDGESVIHEITRISKPSRRVYAKVKNIKPVIGGLGLSILSTSKGLMTDKQAKESTSRLGGEVICKVW